jgi:tRNA G18 (ribose-2'-O)-methylase SpoU
VPIIDLSDPADPRLAPYRDLKDAPARPAAEGRFVAEGEIVLRQVAASRFAIESIIATPGKVDALADLIQSLPAHTPVFRATKPVVDTIIGFAFHRGVIAQGLRGTPRTLAELADTCSTLLIVEEVSNVDNLGGLFRSISALAPPGTGVILSPGCADPLYRKAIRASMGHVLNIPFATVDHPTHWPGAVLQLRSLGYHFAALTPAPGSIDLAAFVPPANVKLALLVGAEGPGLSPALLAAADSSLRIPMRQGVDSLNLVVATSIAMHRMFSL